MRIVVTGASGFIGAALVRALRDRGDEVLPVVRRQPGAGEIGLDLARRQLDTSEVPARSLEGIDAAVHLAGAPITTRWSPKRLEEIRSSRVALGDLLARALASLDEPPAVLVSGLGHRHLRRSRATKCSTRRAPRAQASSLTSAGPGRRATTPAAERGIRVVTIRSGIVLGGTRGGGGVLAAELPAFRLGLGARLGDGRQWTSWIVARRRGGA